jgi:hypothetical protein
MWIPDICNTTAAIPAYEVSRTSELDVGVDTNCIRILTQVSGPEICVLRAGTISVNAGVSFTLKGPRAVAFVADDALHIDGNLYARAFRSTNGPGGGYLKNGGKASQEVGGGGAGFSQAGGAGAKDTDGNGSPGGGLFDPLNAGAFFGGPQSTGPDPGDVKSPKPGGGGGAVLLVSCRGIVSVTGSIDVAGGGGEGGKDLTVIVDGQNFAGGAGGGAGGYVVIQGTEVVVTGNFHANGGGGGGGCTVDDGVAQDGRDGIDTIPIGGNGAGSGGVGGSGGTASVPTNKHSYYGGGGGGAGRFQVYVPAGITPTLLPTSASPSFEPILTVPTR